jgi:hypothetical protein
VLDEPIDLTHGTDSGRDSTYAYCTRAQCPSASLPEVSNGRLACNGSSANDQCILVCEEGFVPASTTAIECSGFVHHSSGNCRRPEIRVTNSVPSTRLFEEAKCAKNAVVSFARWVHPFTRVPLMDMKCKPAVCPNITRSIGSTVRCVGEGIHKICEISCIGGYEYFAGDTVVYAPSPPICYSRFSPIR